jgi:hypothetical protein
MPQRTGLGLDLVGHVRATDCPYCTTTKARSKVEIGASPDQSIFAKTPVAKLTATEPPDNSTRGLETTVWSTDHAKAQRTRTAPARLSSPSGQLLDGLGQARRLHPACRKAGCSLHGRRGSRPASGFWEFLGQKRACAWYDAGASLALLDGHAEGDSAPRRPPGSAHALWPGQHFLGENWGVGSPCWLSENSTDSTRGT